MTKLSDLIRQGAKLRPPATEPRAFTLENGAVCSCALGAAYEAKTGRSPAAKEIASFGRRPPVTLYSIIDALGLTRGSQGAKMSCEDDERMFAFAGLARAARRAQDPAVFLVVYRVNDMLVACKREGDPRLVVAGALDHIGL